MITISASVKSVFKNQINRCFLCVGLKDKLDEQTRDIVRIARILVPNQMKIALIIT
jgi:hypothetical protein